MARMVTVFAIDPGTTTGIAFGAFPLRGTVKGMLQKRKMIIVNQIGRETGVHDWLEMSYAVATMFMAFRDRCMGKGWPEPQLVFEDFILRTQSKARDTLSPLMITGMVLGALREAYGRDEMPMHTLQQPSEAKSFATDDRLKLWDVYEIGKVHGRDATRHLALRLSKVK